jgi:hypothetical protein
LYSSVKIPSTKHQITNKFKYPTSKSKTTFCEAKMFVFGIGILILDIIWDLRFGVWDFFTLKFHRTYTNTKGVIGYFISLD